MKVLCIIPARGGSKGLPGKNIKIINGKPLIVHSIEHALRSGVCDQIVVTTDSKEIRDVALEAGASAPFLRDPGLGEDRTPTEPVLRDALMRMEALEGVKYEIVVFLQPTDIFRDPDWISQCVNTLKSKPEIDSVFAASKTHKNFWIEGEQGRFVRVFDWMATYGPRQTRKTLFREDTGLASALRSELIRSGKRTGDNVEILVTDHFSTSIDIHDEFDFYMAEKALEFFDTRKLSKNR